MRNIDLKEEMEAVTEAMPYTKQYHLGQLVNLIIKYDSFEEIPSVELNKLDKPISMVPDKKCFKSKLVKNNRANRKNSTIRTRRNRV